MTEQDRPRTALRRALLDQEETLSDLRAVLVALDLIASVDDGIDHADMIGLRITIKHARELSETLRRSWRDAVARVGGRIHADAAPLDPGPDET